jgi:ribosomal-protein-alanine N-acetyltransferase
MVIFETEHLLFRPLTQSDLDNLTALYADPEVMRFLGGARNRDEVQRVLNKYISEQQTYGHSFFAIVRKSDQSFIGQCGLLDQEVEGQPEVELVYVLARSYWQHGLAVEGISALKDYGLQKQGLSRVVSLIPPDNQASIYIAEKIGMHYEHDVDQWGERFRLYAVSQSQDKEH